MTKKVLRGNIGHLHPLTLTLRKVVSLFEELGFEAVEGPEIETEWYNFGFLRIPKLHPARDLQDTFWLDQEKLLRTHTSSMQGRVMEKRTPPVRIIVPGKVYRNEATDASHEAVFWHLEGFAIDKEISISHLIGTLKWFIKELLGNIPVRFYPQYYPFVEPGMDVAIFFKGKWLEILGSGMIHPEVLKNMGIDPKRWQGFAFGLGIDRLAMLNYQIPDIRFSYQNDMRFLKQF